MKSKSFLFLGLNGLVNFLKHQRVSCVAVNGETEFSRI